MRPVYPFSAIVGHDRLRLALVLCAVRPEIGGVLIRGGRVVKACPIYARFRGQSVSQLSGCTLKYVGFPL